MSEKIKAVIREINDGAYYEAQLSAIPRKGEYISMYSYADQSSGHKTEHKYEVLDVLHHITDVTDKVPRSKDSLHTITLVVKNSGNSIFS